MRRPRIEVFDLNLLRTLDALYRHRSVNLAAGEIGVSPSAVSHALNRLRQNFEDELFVKGSNGMVPTSLATELSKPVSTALAQLRIILGPQDFDPVTSTRQFRVRANAYATEIFLPRVIRHLREEAPHTSLTVDCEYNKNIADELDTSLLDLVLGTFPILPNRLEWELLFAEKWCWIVSARHPILAGQATTTADLMDLPKLVIAATEVATTAGPTISDAGVERLMVANRKFIDEASDSARHLAVKGTVIVNSGMVVPAIIAETDMVCMVPEGLAHSTIHHPDLAILPFEEEDNMLEHRLIWHRRSNADPAIEWLKSIFRRSADELAQERLRVSGNSE